MERNNILVQIEIRRKYLEHCRSISGINTGHPMYREFMNFIPSRQVKGNKPPSYSSAVAEEGNENIECKDNQWQIMIRYFDTTSYVVPTYKYKMHYEAILSSIGSVEFLHFYPATTKRVYNFSKFIIKMIYTPEHKPNWFCQWWILYGPSVNIFPEEYKKLYVEWVDVSTKLLKLQKYEFSIPWILKWTIEVQMNEEGFPCLRRKFHTKFWSKLLQRDAEGKRQSKVIQGKDDISPFKRITRKVQMEKGAISILELLASYMEEVTKDLVIKMGLEFLDNISMATSNKEQDNCTTGESQSVHSTEEMDIETFLQQFKNQIE
ncbi:hypothetical protein H5410_060486 [Solanum commersonii]|uniref:Uncharacterized protein n=1 Tax=Solanum commersonii TaxID=4109 RepID=A0A9J5W663_SOLCO|nr:hypothetical protein H5410_060486 [Solanum commersonii]